MVLKTSVIISLTFYIASIAPTTSAFAPRPVAVPAIRLVSVGYSPSYLPKGETATKLKARIQEDQKEKDEHKNESSSLVGKRGEVFLAAQGVLMASIVLGRFPFTSPQGIPFLDPFGPLATVLGGTTLVLSGSFIMYLSAKELGGSLSHWSVPVEKEDGGQGLVSTGVYSLVRHPMYIGLLTAMAGLAVATDSALRLYLTLALFLVLEFKATHEETKLQEAYPNEYEDYKKKVKGKILPMSFF